MSNSFVRPVPATKDIYAMRIWPSSILIFCGVTCALGSSSAPSHADVTIVSKATMVGAMPGQQRRSSGVGGADALNSSGTTTTYFQGNKVRIVDEHIVFLYDGDTHTRYRIDDTRKTYSVVPNELGGIGRFMGMLDVKTTVSVAPTGKTQKIAGLPAKEYAYNESVAVSLKPGAFSMGVPPAKTASATAAPMPAMQIKVHGQQWVAQIPGLPNDIGAVISESSGMSQLTDTVPGLKALIDQLKALKGYPIATQQSFTLTGMGMPAAAGAKPGVTMSIDTKTTSISQAPLPKSLFLIPAGYKRVEQAAPFPTGPGRKRAMPPPAP